VPGLISVTCQDIWTIMYDSFSGLTDMKRHRFWYHLHAYLIGASLPGPHKQHAGSWFHSCPSAAGGITVRDMPCVTLAHAVSQSDTRSATSRSNLLLLKYNPDSLAKGTGSKGHCYARFQYDRISTKVVLHARNFRAGCTIA
jgi:hypothetical protein